MNGLTTKQARFIDEFFVDFNATRAAERAKYQGDDNTLAVIGSRLLRNVKVAEKIKARLDASAMSANEALSRLADMARADVGDFLVYDPDTHDFKVDWDSAKGKTHLIKTIKHTAHGITFELHDPQAAIDKILKAGGEYTQRVEHTGKDGSDLLPAEGIVNALLAIRKTDE